MSDDEFDTMPDGTPALWSQVLRAGEGAENDGAIDIEDLQILRELSALLKAFRVMDVATLKALLSNSNNKR